MNSLILDHSKLSIELESDRFIASILELESMGIKKVDIGYEFVLLSLETSKVVRIKCTEKLGSNFTFKCHWSEQKALKQIEVLLSVPRPQMLKRILELVGCVGVKNLTLFASQNTFKSYLTSSVLNEQNILSTLRKGMCQGIQPCYPNVIVYDKYSEFKNYFLFRTMENQGFSGFIFDDKASTSFLKLLQIMNKDEDNKHLIKSILIAIGPESGWTSGELNLFSNSGFKKANLGSAVLRVENALNYALAQSELVNMPEA